MTPAEYYEQQNQWRNWNSYLRELPIKETDIVLDMGCGTGQVTSLLAERCLHVIGIDRDFNSLLTAKKNNYSANVSFINSDLNEVSHTEIPLADGIWCSFAAAYFPDFQPVLSNWLRCLKSGGWIALVEIDDLFGHLPLSKHTENIFRTHYSNLREQFTYDFEMGSKLNEYLTTNGLNIIFEQNMEDAELAFNGPASNLVLRSWENRLDRMSRFQNVLGNFLFSQVKTEFINCLEDHNHICNAIVKYVIAFKDRKSACNSSMAE